MLEKYPDDVSLVIKHFPISSHRFARKAAQAALAADKQGKYWEFHGKLLENYKQLNDAKLEEIAKELALDYEQLKKDMQSPETEAMIVRDLQDGQDADVKGTPTVFLNGKRLRIRSPGDLFQKVAAEVQKQKGHVE